MQEIKKGFIIVDKGCIPVRVGVVVEVDEQSFTIKHFSNFLSFKSEHPFHTFNYDEQDEYDVLASLSEDHPVVSSIL